MNSVRCDRLFTARMSSRRKSEKCQLRFCILQLYKSPENTNFDQILTTIYKILTQMSTKSWYSLHPYQRRNIQSAWKTQILTRDRGLHRPGIWYFNMSQNISRYIRIFQNISKKLKKKDISIYNRIYIRPVLTNMSDWITRFLIQHCICFDVNWTFVKRWQRSSFLFLRNSLVAFVTQKSVAIPFDDDHWLQWWWRR